MSSGNGTSFSFSRPRATASQPVRGRAYRSDTPALSSCRRIVKRVRCAIHARRRPASKVHRRNPAVRVACCQTSPREPDSEADLTVA